MPQAESNVLPYGGAAIGVLLDCIAEHGRAVITGMPCREGNGPLLELANGLGTVNPYGAGASTRDGEGVHLVTPYSQPVLDVTGKPMLSNTTTDFELHTDESFAQTPSRYVLMQCWREDSKGGGESLLANSEAVLARLEPWAAELCYRAIFVWRKCSAPIFTRRPGLDWPVVRFNAREIAGDELEGEPDLRARILPEVFLAAANAAADRVLLESGDCVVLDNRRVLHGRAAFDPASSRLLKRVWVKVADDRATPALAAGLTAQ